MTRTAKTDRLRKLNEELVRTHNTHVRLGARLDDEVRRLRSLRDAAQEMADAYEGGEEIPPEHRDALDRAAIKLRAAIAKATAQ